MAIPTRVLRERDRRMERRYYEFVDGDTVLSDPRTCSSVLPPPCFSKHSLCTTDSRLIKILISRPYLSPLVLLKQNSRDETSRIYIKRQKLIDDLIYSQVWGLLNYIRKDKFKENNEKRKLIHSICGTWTIHSSWSTKFSAALSPPNLTGVLYCI